MTYLIKRISDSESTHLVLFAKLHLLFGAVGAAVFHATIQNLALVGRGAPVGCSVCGKLLVKWLQNLTRWKTCGEVEI